jgi:prolyl oligopeptidase
MNNAYFSIALVALIVVAMAPIFYQFRPISSSIRTPSAPITPTLISKTQVPDPYRWLEDENSTDTKAWVEAQNKVTFGYLEKIPYRLRLKSRIEKLVNYPRYGQPSRNGEYFSFLRTMVCKTRA